MGRFSGLQLVCAALCVSHVAGQNTTSSTTNATSTTSGSDAGAGFCFELNSVQCVPKLGGWCLVSAAHADAIVRAFAADYGVAVDKVGLASQDCMPSNGCAAGCALKITAPASTQSEVEKCRGDIAECRHAQSAGAVGAEAAATPTASTDASGNEFCFNLSATQCLPLTGGGCMVTQTYAAAIADAFAGDLGLPAGTVNLDNTHCQASRCSQGCSLGVLAPQQAAGGLAACRGDITQCSRAQAKGALGAAAAASATSNSTSSGAGAPAQGFCFAMTAAQCVQMAAEDGCMVTTEQGTKITDAFAADLDVGRAEVALASRMCVPTGCTEPGSCSLQVVVPTESSAELGTCHQDISRCSAAKAAGAVGGAAGEGRPRALYDDNDDLEWWHWALIAVGGVAVVAAVAGVAVSKLSNSRKMPNLSDLMAEYEELEREDHARKAYHSDV